jgi:hypothetical protein
MNRTKSSVAVWAGRIGGFSAMASVSAAAMAFTVPGGIIYFRGSLVAPPFSVAAQAAGLPGAFVAQNSTEADGTSGQAATVTFIAPPYSTPNAEVALTATTDAGSAAAMRTGFVDGRGKHIRPASNGAYHIGATGGTLSMQPVQANGGAAVTVTTTYN